LDLFCLRGLSQGARGLHLFIAFVAGSWVIDKHFNGGSGTLIRIQRGGD